jgi:hypothetical protein
VSAVSENLIYHHSEIGSSSPLDKNEKGKITGTCSVVLKEVPLGDRQLCQNIRLALLNEQEEEVANVRLAGTGEFKFERISSGRYHLQVEKNGWRIEVFPGRKLVLGDQVEVRLFPPF